MNELELKKQITIGVILIIIGISFFINDFIKEKREKVFSAMNLELTELLAYEEENTDEESTEEEQEQTVNTTPNLPEATLAPKRQEKKYESYIGILEIPKINFNKGFYKKESSLNNVKFNIKIIPQSDYPDEDKGNVIIIGHSGNYNNSYFRDLYKLELNDTAMIKYNNKIYTYKIVNIYTEAKDGLITVYRDERKSCLTLITCTKDDSTTETIYILELDSIQ